MRTKNIRTSNKNIFLIEFSFIYCTQSPKHDILTYTQSNKIGGEYV